MTQLSQDKRNRALGKFDAGMECLVVARHLGIQNSTISRLKDRLRVTVKVNDHPRSGRPRTNDELQDLYISLQDLLNRFKTATSIEMETRRHHNPQISVSTLKRRLSATCRGHIDHSKLPP